ncbi:MAG: helix-turn-helix domain-containing protein [Clostridia bacterium]|nr:helix-turn-helix domain-containing protein [Clostridia bacterium]
MRLYKIGIKSIPRIAFAHEYASDDYEMQFPAQAGTIEITYLLEGDIFLEREGKTERIPAGSVLVSHRTAPERTYAAGRQAHVTVGLRAEWEEGALLLPNYAVFPNKAYFEQSIRAIIREYARSGETTPRLSAMAMGLLCDVDEAYRRLQQSPAARYAELAEQYILDHLTERIYVEQIAEAAGVSVGYLSRIFRQATGKTPVEYIHTVKLQRVRELVEKGLPVHRAGAAVGWEDPGYLCRLHKKYYGITLKRGKIQ